ncbi:DNA polymerase IV [Lysobacter rhizosphaerae]
MEKWRRLGDGLFMPAMLPSAGAHGKLGCRAARKTGRSRYTFRVPSPPATTPPLTAAPRKIVHVDMDAFYASVEQRDDPDLRGKPVVVAWRGARSVVCAASYEARKFGVRSAMPAVRAERLCPQAVFVPPDFTRYKAVSRQVREIFARHTDLIEPLSLDEAYLDVTVTKTGLPTATETAEAIRAAIREETQLTASAGVAPNKFLAKIASDWRKPDGLFVVRPHQVLAFLEPLPVGRLPGVGKVMEGKLAQFGITTVGDLRALRLEELEQRFGRWGQRLHELSLGIDDHPVQSERPTMQISAEDTFETDLLLEELEPHIRRLAEKAWAGYERERESEDGRLARTVVLKLKTADFRTLTRSLTPLARPESLRQVADIACELRARVELPSRTRYRLVGVGLSGFVDPDSAAAQDDLFSATDEPQP